METKKRRTRGEGTLYQHSNGNWVAQFQLPNGIRKTVSGRTKSIAVKKLNALREKVSRGESTERNATPFGEYLAHWVEESARISVRESTLVRYRIVIDKHIAPFTAAKIRLDKLTAPDVQKLYSDVSNAGASPRMLRYVHQVIHKACNDAVKSGVMFRNPAAAVSAPKYHPSTVNVLSIEALMKFLNESKSDRFYPLYLLAVMSGMRQGELLALEWNCVDFEKGTVTIRASLQEIQGKLIVSQPKTKSGNRKIPLPVEVMSVLADCHARQIKTAPDSNLVFPDTNGTYVGRSRFAEKSSEAL